MLEDYVMVNQLRPSTLGRVATKQVKAAEKATEKAAKKEVKATDKAGEKPRTSPSPTSQKHPAAADDTPDGKSSLQANINNALEAESARMMERELALELKTA